VAYHIGDREKSSPESIHNRIRYPVNSKISIEVTEGGNFNSRMCIIVLSCQVSEVGKSQCSIS
jgi:hypothetical protein